MPPKPTAAAKLTAGQKKQQKQDNKAKVRRTNVDAVGAEGM